MKRSRRDFFRMAGLLAAAALAARCGRAPTPEVPPMMTCYPPAVPPTVIPPSDLDWATVRDCWYTLGDRPWVFEQAGSSTRDLVRQHEEALQALRDRGEVDGEVAALIGAAFQEAAERISPPTLPPGTLCYRMTLPFEQQTARDVWEQARVLEEMAQRSSVDPETVELAQAALGRDMAWLALFKSGETESLEDVEVDPVSAEAARVLVELLVGGGD